MTEYTREELIALCERGRVPQEKWDNRDSSDAQMQMGEAWALLSAGCEFNTLHDGGLVTDDKTVWIEIKFKGFGYFEMGDMKRNTFYLPTARSLDLANGGDWY